MEKECEVIRTLDTGVEGSGDDAQTFFLWPGRTNLRIPNHAAGKTDNGLKIYFKLSLKIFFLN